jgi:hypothetical protein
LKERVRGEKERPLQVDSLSSPLIEGSSMKREISHELSIWLQYLLIAFVAETLAFVSFFPRCDNCAFQMSALIRNMWEEYEQPRLLTWLIIFLVLSGVRFLVVNFTRRETAPNQDT